MDNKGVTLIELAIVLMVLSVSLGIMGMSVSSYSAKELDSACMELQADLRYAQRQAVIENKKYEVVFSRTQNRYTVSRQESEMGFSRVIKEKPFGGDIVLVDTTAVGSAVVYTARGTTANPCTITLQNNEYIAIMTVNLGSGRVSTKSFTKIN